MGSRFIRLRPRQQRRGARFRPKLNDGAGLCPRIHPGLPHKIDGPQRTAAETFVECLGFNGAKRLTIFDEIPHATSPHRKWMWPPRCKFIEQASWLEEMGPKKCSM